MNRVALVGVEPTILAAVDFKSTVYPVPPQSHERRERESNPQGFRSTLFKSASVAHRIAPPDLALLVFFILIVIVVTDLVLIDDE